VSSVVFGDPWAAFGCLRTAIGAPFVTFGGNLGASGVSLGSICRLWGSIWAPFGIWAPLGVVGGHFGCNFCHWGSSGSNSGEFKVV